jgi:ornithine cyclodeaminase/alanine dehydrogenase-like protein (mu-crystallin family)
MPAQHAQVKTLILTGKQVKKLLDMKDVLGAVENAFKHKGLGKVQMPPKVYLFYQKFDGDLRTMPSYVERNRLQVSRKASAEDPRDHRRREPGEDSDARADHAVRALRRGPYL